MTDKLMLRAKINYTTHEFPEGISILDALRSLNIEVPTLCKDERLKACGSCRMCLVNVQGIPHPVTSCTTQLEDGMVIETHAHELENERRMLLKEIVDHYPADALQQVPDKPFHRWLLHYGLEKDCNGSHQANLIDDSHPYIHVDMSQCITCHRCVRVCEDVQGSLCGARKNVEPRHASCMTQQQRLPGVHA